MNTNESTNAVIVSNDTRLRNSIIEASLENTSGYIFSVENDVFNLVSKPASDIYIYDVDLDSHDIEATHQSISNLKNISAEKPLLLIGKQQILNEILANEDINNIVTRTVAKPLSYRQLKLAIDSVKTKPSIHVPPSKSGFRPRQLAVICLTTTALLLAAITLIRDDDSQLSVINESVEVTRSPENTSPLKVNSDLPASQEVAKLNQLALAALAQGQLTTPEDGSAWYFLKQIETLDSYNAVAHESRKKLFSILEASYEEKLAGKDEGEIENALLALVEVQPYNQKYSNLLDQHHQKINNQKKSQIVESQIVESELQVAKELNTEPAQQDTLANSSASIEIDNVTKQTKAPPLRGNKTKNADKSKANPLNKNEQLASVDMQVAVKPEVIIEPAKVLKRAQADYPRHAASLNHEGWVELEYQVDANGEITNLQVKDGERVKTFENSAIRAIKQWEFSPSKNTATNESVLSEPMTAKFEFTLDG